MGRQDAIEAEVSQLVEEVCGSLGLELYDLVFRRSGPRWKLQVFVQRDDGNVGLDDCANLSRQLSRELDVLDPIPHAYDLEVSSPGMERALRHATHWRAAVGKQVQVKWRNDRGAVQSEVLQVEDFQDETVTVRRDDESCSIPLSSIVSAKVHVDWSRQ